MISTCVGYNQVIKTIEPEWTNHSRWTNRYVYDFEVETTDGTFHSLTNCCSFPLESVEEIKNYWLSHDGKEYIDWYNWWAKGMETYEESFAHKVVRSLKNDEVVFLANGRLNPDWKYEIGERNKS